RAFGQTVPGGGGGGGATGNLEQQEKLAREVSDVPVEAVIGGQPSAGDTEHANLASGSAFHSLDGILDVVETGGQPVQVTYDPIPPEQLAAMNNGDFPGPTPPVGELRVGAANVQIQPLS